MNTPRIVALLGLSLVAACGETTFAERKHQETNVEQDRCAAVTCEAISACHSVGVCNPATGLCSEPLRADGSACDDGNACTYGTQCRQGVCGGAQPVVCYAPDDCHEAGTCNPDVGCVPLAKANGSTCSDGNSCTQQDSCQQGACLGAPVVCAATDQCHTQGVCNPANGMCDNPVKLNGTACDSGTENLCANDVCDAGVCTPKPLVCTALNNCHQPGVCNPATGLCSNPIKVNGSSCEDGDLCSTGDLCVAGSCVGGGTLACPPAPTCQIAAACDPQLGCTFVPAANGSACDDGNPCTLSDSCASGRCGGTPRDCSSTDPCLDNGVCNLTNGQCTTPWKPNGTVCNDGNACTTVDTCLSGSCGGNQVQCQASDSCHLVGVCNPGSGLCNDPQKDDGSICNDGDSCTETDVCTAGSCGGSPVVCAASTDPCRLDGICAQATGRCEYLPVVNGTACDDEDICTQSDLCQNGICVGLDALSCAGAPCLINPFCDPGTGLCAGEHVTNGSLCDDGNNCTSTDSCQSGECVGSAPTACSAADACHAPGTCDRYSGLCTNPEVFTGSCGDDGLCFVNYTAQSRVEFGGAGATPQIGASAIFLDYDGDTFMDILLAGEAGPPKLFRNGVDGTFLDVSEAVGLPTNTPPSAMMGAVVADWDNDGDTDIYFLVQGENRFYRNTAGHFTDVTATTMPSGATLWSTGAAFGDFDHDGDLDLYVANYIKQSSFPNHVGGANQLLVNNGNGTFSELATSYGVAGSGTTLSVLWTDINADGWIDLIACNAFGATVQANRVYVNAGLATVDPASRFVEDSATWGMDVAMHCRGIAYGDYDRDGDADYYMTNLGNNVLFEADSGSYSDVAAAAGAQQGANACNAALRTASWGAAFEDFDRDGWLDLYVANGHMPIDASLGNAADSPNTILLNDTSGGFVDVGASAFVADPRRGRGAAFADFDQDGDLDILQANVNGQAQVFLNNSVNSHHWLQVDLRGRESNRDGLGATIRTKVPTFTLVHEVNRQGGYQSSSDKAHLFGLGTQTDVAELEVHWPLGAVQNWYHVDVDQSVRLVEPRVITGTVSLAASVAVGATLTGSVQVTNRATTSVTVDLRVVLYDGTTLLMEDLPGSSVMLPGQTKSIPLTITIPTNLVSVDTLTQVVVEAMDTAQGFDQSQAMVTVTAL